MKDNVIDLQKYKLEKEIKEQLKKLLKLSKFK